MSDPKNIVRIDIDHRNTHGWQVRVARHGKRHTKFFSDSRYGGSDEAYEAAEAYRDQLIEELPEPLSGAERAALVRSTSGVPGIRLGYSDGIPRIEADALTSEGERKVRSFSLRKWGLRRALWKACVWKADFMGLEKLEEMHRLYETAYPNIKRQLAANGIEDGAEDGAENGAESGEAEE